MIKPIKKILFISYLLVIPLRLFPPFTILFNYFSFLAISNNFIFHILGLFIIFLEFIQGTHKLNSKAKNLLIIIFILNLTTLLNSIFINLKYGSFNGETSFQAVIGLILLYFQVGLIVYYNTTMIPIFTVSFFKKIFNFYYFILIFFGYLQIILLFYPQISVFYDSINFLNILRSSDFILRINRISVTGSEPASVVLLASFLVIPSELSKFIESRNFLNIFKLILIMPILYFTSSSTVYIAFAVNSLLFLFIYIKKLNFSRKVFLAILFFLGTFVFIIFIPDDVMYFLVDKVFDTTNQSTLYRISTLINDFFVFLRYPIFGIGNGNQGFYFNNVNWPIYFFNSQEFTNAYNGSLGIINGGSFLPSFISGYGLFGSLLLIIFLSRTFNYFKSKHLNSYIFYLCLLSNLTFLFVSILSNDIVGNFAFLLPFSFLFINGKISL